MPSFDVVSEVNQHELSNAVDQAIVVAIGDNEVFDHDDGFFGFHLHT